MSITKNLEPVILLKSEDKLPQGFSSLQEAPYFLCPAAYFLLFFCLLELIHFCLDSKGQYFADVVSEFHSYQS